MNANSIVVMSNWENGKHTARSVSAFTVKLLVDIREADVSWGGSCGVSNTRMHTCICIYDKTTARIVGRWTEARANDSPEARESVEIHVQHYTGFNYDTHSYCADSYYRRLILLNNSWVASGIYFILYQFIYLVDIHHIFDNRITFVP